MKRRKHATYRCLGAGCDRQVRLRVAARSAPKPKPMMWKLAWARAQDADGGILREVSLVFCSQQCQDDPVSSGDLAAKVNSYLGVHLAAPDVVTYQCVACAATEPLTRPQHRHNSPHVPDGWLQVPLLAVDYDCGIGRCTTLVACSEACLKTLDPDAPAEAQPAVVQRELARVLAGLATSDEDAVFA